MAVGSALGGASAVCAPMAHYGPSLNDFLFWLGRFQ